MNFLKKILNKNIWRNSDNNSKEEKVVLDITGMTCDHCAVNIERLLEETNGILSKKVSHTLGKGEVTFNPDLISKEEIIQSINQSINHLPGKRSG